jgi:acyl dehydratase
MEIRGRGRRGLISWRRQLVNQDGIAVQEGIAETLVEVRADNSSANDTSSDAS